MVHQRWLAVSRSCSMSAVMTGQMGTRYRGECVLPWDTQESPGLVASAVLLPVCHGCCCCCSCCCSCCRTYATLVGKEGAGRGRTRLEQVVSWVGGPAWDGLLVLDECHK
jgi:hypothetical protein